MDLLDLALHALIDVGDHGRLVESTHAFLVLVLEPADGHEAAHLLSIADDFAKVSNVERQRNATVLAVVKHGILESESLIHFFCEEVGDLVDHALVDKYALHRVA